MKKKILAVWMALLMILCACSGEKQNGEPAQDMGKDIPVASAGFDSGELAWKIEEKKLPLMVEPDDIPEGAWMTTYFCEMVGETIYCLNVVCVNQEDGTSTDVGYVVEKMEAPYESWDICMYKGVEEWLEGDTCFLLWYPWSTGLSEDGAIHMLLKGTEKTWLCQWKEGEYSLAELGESISLIIGTEEADSVKDMYVDKEGNLYLANDKGVQSITENSQTLPWVSPERTTLKMQENPFSGQRYLFGNTKTGGFYVQEWGSEQTQLTDDRILMGERDKVVWDSKDSGYLCDSQRICRFAVTDGKVQEVPSLWEYGYFVDQILDGWAGKDGELTLLVLVNDRYRLLEMKGVVCTGKTKMELAAYSPDLALKEAVRRFNYSNSEYFVEIRQAEEGEWLADFRTRIQAEMSAGKGPDLLAQDVFTDLEVMAENSQLLELNDFFSEEDSILPGVWECGKIGENLYALPYGFEIQTLVTTRDAAGGRTGWTVEELIQCVRESGVKQFSYDFAGDILFWHLCGGDGVSTDMIDWENGICHFDSSQAEELLEFAREYSGDIDYIMDDIRVLEGDAMTSWGLMHGTEAFSSNICVYQDGQVYIGYPTAEGGSGHILDTNMVGISGITQNKEGAVAFLQYLISEDIQENMAEKLCISGATMSFPIRKQALEHLYGYLLNVPLEEGADVDTVYFEYGPGVGIGDYEFPMLPFTEENVGQMRTVIETARPRPIGSDVIGDIISEETESFFAGGKSATEVLSIIQNRVQLYFDERQ